MSSSAAAAVSPVASAPPRPARSPWYALELLDNRYAALHGLRVLAILSVVQFHVTWIFGEQRLAFDQDLTGMSLAVFFGMDLFFILSGFLIGSILFHSIDTAGKTQLGRFYLRRIFRTFPSYYLVLTFLALTTVLTATQRAHLVYEYAYLTNLVSLERKDILMFWGWSLAFEEQFYLLVPFLLVVLTRLRGDRARILILVGLCALALALRFYVFASHYPWEDPGKLPRAIYFRPLTRYDTLIVGILLALVHRRWGGAITAWLKAPFHRVLLALPSMTLLWILLFPVTVVGIQNLQVFHLFAWGTLTGLMYFPALLLLLHADGPIQRFLSAPIFRRIATLGYGIYLVHIPIVDELAIPMAARLQKAHVSSVVAWILAFLLTIVCSLAIAYVLHVLVEKPSMRLRDRLTG